MLRASYTKILCFFIQKLSVSLKKSCSFHWWCVLHFLSKQTLSVSNTKRNTSRHTARLGEAASDFHVRSTFNLNDVRMERRILLNVCGQWTIQTVQLMTSRSFSMEMEMCSSCEEYPEQARLDTIPVHSIHAHATISVAHIYNSSLIERKSVWFSLYRRLQMIFSLTPVDLCCSIILPAISIIVTHCERKICWPSYIQRGIEHSTASSNPADYFPSRITWNGYNFNSIVQTAHVFVNE